MADNDAPPAAPAQGPAASSEAPFAAYRGAEANGDLAHIHPGLRHLAVPVDQVLLDPANVNKHPDYQLEVIKGMLRTFGQRAPLITRESTGVLEAGEGRLLAGRALGWRYMAVLPCADDLLAARMFALGDNRSAELAIRDEEEQAVQLLALHEQGIDLAIIGWDEDDLGVLLDERDGAAELPEPDPVEEPAVPWTQPGERRTIANDDLGLDGTRDLVARAARAWPLRPGGVWYVCSPSGDMETAFRFGLVDADERLRSAIAWVKNQFVLGHLDYHYQHETILYGWREGAGHFWCGSRSESSVWEIAKPAKSADHPTMKPLELLARAIGNSSVRGDVVFDGFGGSGQTLFAANGLGRRARLVELSPGFCDVIAQRARELGLEVMVDRPGVGRIPWGEALAA